MTAHARRFTGKLSRIKLLLTDVEGVLTDGGLYYTDGGLDFKKFNGKDGMAVKLLRETGLLCGVISSDKSDIIKTRAERLKMDFALTGVWEKKAKAEELCAELGISLENCAFIGDDVNDIELIAASGFSACPADAVRAVQDSVDYVSTLPGGNGVFREIADMILKSK